MINLRDRGFRWVLNTDIEACFDNIDQTILLDIFRRVITDWFVINLVEIWLKTGRRKRKQAIGIPQGAILSPLWCNIYLHNLDGRLSTTGWHLVRYADDFIVMCNSQQEAQQSLKAVGKALNALHLNLSAPKTSITSFEEGFRFLGVAFLRDTFEYICEQKRISVSGSKVKALYRYPPAFY